MTAAPHRHFHDELAELKQRLLEMSGRAEENLGRAVRALLDRDGGAAARVVADDAALDAAEIAIEDMVTNLLALQQPVARDLRLLLAALKISSDLERVGDHAVNIAESASRLLTYRAIAAEPELLEMVQLAREMLGRSLDAFVRGDAQAARAVCTMDDRVDALHRSMFNILSTHMAQDPQTIGAALELFLVSRNLERVADLATNVAEDVVFLVEGKTIKHHAEERES